MDINKLHMAIISNGPSANLYKPDPQYDIVAGVNLQACKYRCDWWVLCDGDPFAYNKPIGHPKIFIRRAMHEILPELYGTDPEVPVRYESYEKVVQEDVIHLPWPTKDVCKEIGIFQQWNQYTGLAALGLAVYLKMNQVTVFGADMIGSQDAQDQFKKIRTEKRWSRERNTWEYLTNLIESMYGTHFVRVVTHHGQT